MYLSSGEIWFIVIVLVGVRLWGQYLQVTSYGSRVPEDYVGDKTTAEDEILSEKEWKY